MPTGEIVVGILNNMSDGSLRATEHQFCSLFHSASPVPIRILLYTLRSIVRSSNARRYLDSVGYRPSHHLAIDRPHCLVITGAEPAKGPLCSAPFWGELVEVLKWAIRTERPIVLSCLATHAALDYVSKVGRHKLPVKCFGVYNHITCSDHPLTRQVLCQLPVPHSRWHTIDTSQIIGAGYIPLIWSPLAGAHCFINDLPMPWLFMQGHPEYSATTLIKEYRRDMERFLAGISPSAPMLPSGILDQENRVSLEGFATLARKNRQISLMKDFPWIKVDDHLAAAWQEPTRQLIANWLAMIAR